MGFLPFLLLLLPLASTQATYHIRPTSDSPCPHEDCLTLSEYASKNWSYSNSDNLTLVFLPGEHVLNTSIDFQLLESVSLLGNDSSLPNITSKIVCRESSAFVLQNIHSVEIKALAFVSCGRLDNSKVSITIPELNGEYDTVKVQNVFPAISALVVMNLHLDSCQFQDNFLPLLLNATEAYASGSQFMGNTGGLGGAVAAYSSTIFFLGHNHFINNLADFGGGIFANNSKLVITGSTVFHANNAENGGGIGARYSTLTFGETSEAAHNRTDLQGTSSVLLDNSTSGQKAQVDTCRNNTEHIPSVFSDVLFIKNKGNGGAIFTMYSKLTTINTNITFVENNGLIGGAIYSKNSQFQIGTTSRKISCSSALTGHVLVTFRRNFAIFGGAFGADNSFVLFIDNTTFDQNQEGAISIETSDIEFSFGSHAAFISNEGSDGAGISASQYSNLQFSGEVLFFRNRARVCGGGIHLDSNSRLIFNGTGTFINNSAADSGGVFSITDGSTIGLENGNITMAMNSAGNNGGAMSVEGGKHFIYGRIDFVGNWAEHNGGAIHVENSYLINMNGQYRFEDNAAWNNGYGGAIYADETEITLSGSYSFTNNSATYGGGMAIISHLNYFFYLEPYTSVSFRDNHAGKYGGAVFVEDDLDYYCDPDRKCFISLATSTRLENLLPESNNSRLPECMGHFVLEGNYAEEGGTAIYGGALHNCRVDTNSRGSCSYKYNMSGLDAIATLTRVTVKQLTLNPLNITSGTYKVCIYDSQKPNSKPRVVNYTAYPGETTSLPLAVIENNRIAPVRIIHAEISNKTDKVQLGELQNTQPITTPCSHLGYTLFSKGTRSARLVLSAEGQCRIPGIPLVVHMDFLPCPFGFSLSQSGSCICEKRVQKYTNSCDINGRTFTRNGDFWLGFDSHGAILHPHCPFDYCKLETVSFTHNSTDLQCVDGRSGILCGACKSGLSLNLGSSHCSACSNVYLLLFLPFAIAGFLLVIFLFTCKVTVAAGTTSGLIFYANVLAVNRSVFFPPNETNILTVFIAWLNLDLGIETCLLDGLDVYTWMWLQFVFPIYIWTLVGLIALVSYYSTTFARIIGPTNPISVLATLFLLSYTKLLRTIIATFSFTTLDYPNDRKVTVWVYDGNIGYLEGKHIPLLLAGLLAFLFLFLPYTLLLLFGQCIEAGSNHKLLSWANNPKVRSFLDAYHGPYKNRHRYWTGLLLLLRFVLFIISAVIDINSPRDPSVNLLFLNITMVGLSVWAWNTGSMHKNWYNNALESSFILNLAILASVFNQVKVEGGNQAAVVYTSVSVAFVTFLGIVTYHVLQRVVDSRIWRHSAVRSKLNRLKDNRRQHQDPIEMAVPSTAPRPHPVTTTFVDLRESLLESQH